ncbi:MAG: dienelactone hydrolase family protein [Acidimicrobiales bacterium]
MRYPDAGHGFHRDGSAAYHAESAADAWQRTLDWFARYLTTGATEVV